ncbi:MAG: hypothetical protein ACK5OX_16105 [Desertimonas sp.]
MITTVADAVRPPVAPTAANGVLLLPTSPRRLGPVSRRLVTRLIVALAVVVVAGTVMTIVGGTAARAAGLSLVFPGGGFLYLASPLWFVVTMVLLALAIVLWWGISAHWAIPLVWLGSALACGLLAGTPRPFVGDDTTWPWMIPVVFALAVGSVAVALVRMERTHRRKLAKVPELNEYLSTAVLPRREPDPNEPTDFDAELLGWVYDMALQPLDQFRGFDWGEQIHGPTCVRYQLNMMGYALAAYAANQLPNCPQPVEDALSNLILKATDLRVWKYWRTLNTIGNFDRNPDPIVRDNIMISAYLADQINLYEAATGSARFDEPGSLTFVWKDGRTFEYDHHSIAEAVRRNFEANPLGFFPCEPGWVFTACNTMGAQALKGHDTLHGTALWPTVEPRWRDAVEIEMMTPDGNLPHIRSKLVGLSFDTGEVPGGEYFSTGTNGFADVAPDLALRAGLLGLRGVEEQMAALRERIVDGVLQLDVDPAPERNTLITTAVPQWTRIIGGARAVGMYDLAAAAMRRMERDCGTGQRWPERPLHVGVQNMGIHLMVRWGSPLNTAKLALRGYRPPVGPVLRDGPWDQLLVTSASSPDGAALDVALRPRVATSASATLMFDSLTPGGRYELAIGDRSAPVTADGDGRAAVEITVDGPSRLRLDPAASGA